MQPVTSSEPKKTSWELSAEQRAAAHYVGGPLRIIAGAGTGKTSTLTARFVHLVENHNIPAHEILAVTFSSKAAAEMRSRIVAALGGNHRRLWIQTFHALCLRLLGEWARAAGRPDPRVLSEIERRRTIRSAISSIPLADRHYYHGVHGSRVLERDLIGYADRAWDDLVDPALAPLDHELPARLIDLNRALSAYRAILNAEGVYDFGTLTAETIRRLEADPDLRAATQARFRHLLVDEFQDTNHAQFRLIELLVPAGNEICVVGDKNQAIYAFRGGRSEYFDTFSSRFKGARNFQLTENYRSTEAILSAANNLVSNNKDEAAQLQLVSMQSDLTGMVTVTVSETAELEAEAVARRILAIVHDNAKDIRFNQIAVLFRSVRGSADPFRRAFTLYGIPLSLGPILGLDYAIRQDLRASLRLITSGPNWADASRLALSRGGRALARQALERRFPEDVLTSLLTEGGNEELPEDEQGFLTICRSIAQGARSVDGGSLAMLMYRAIQIAGHLNETIDPAQARQLTHLVDAAALLESRDDLADLLGAPSRELEDQPPDDTSGVPLLTVHAAKGLEWPVVFVVGMAETVFPLALREERDGDIQSLIRHMRDRNDLLEEDLVESERQHVQEERRLAYVAITRAKRELHLSWARGYGDATVQPSRFIAELGITTADTLIYDDEYERLTSEYALGRQLRYRQAVALRVKPDSDEASTALSDLLVAQWAAGRVPGVNPMRNRTVPLPYDEGASIEFSPTQLSTYADCPRQYLYSALLRLDREETGAALLLGNAVHRALELVNRIRAESGEIPTDEQADEIIEENWPQVGFDVAVQSEQFLRRAKAMVRRYLAYERSLPAGRTPVWIEQYHRVPYERHQLRGKVDAVMRNPDGSVQILDYKTGGHEPYTKSRQLFLYAHMWLNLSEDGFAAPLETAFIALKHSDDKGFRVGAEWDPKQLRAATVTDKWLAERSEDIDTILDGIASNDFHTNPGSRCERCRFNGLCPDG